MLILVNHPEIQKHIQDEIDDVIGKRRPSSDDRHSMPYLRAVVFELLRFINPSYIMHETTENTSLQGYSLPKNTSVRWLSYSCTVPTFNSFIYRVIVHDNNPLPSRFTGHRCMDDLTTAFIFYLLTVSNCCKLKLNSILGTWY